MKIYKYIKIYVEKVEKYLLFMLKYNIVYKKTEIINYAQCANIVYRKMCLNF